MSRITQQGGACAAGRRPRSYRSRMLALFALVALLGLLAAACADDDDPDDASADEDTQSDDDDDGDEADDDSGDDEGDAGDDEEAAAEECDEPDQITWSLPVTSAAQTLAPLAQAAGLFEAQCLEVETPTVGGSQNGIAAAVTGETQLFNSDALNLTRAIIQDTGVVVLAFPAVQPVFDLVVHESIQEPEDLEGTRLGVSRIGNSTHFQLLRALESIGVDPETIDFITLDDYPGIYAGITAGEVDGGMATIPFNERLIETGEYHRIVDLQEITAAAYPSSLAATHESVIEEDRDMLVRALTAYVQAIQLWKEDPEEAKAVLRDFLLLEDEEELTLTQEWFAQVFQDEPIPQVDQMSLVVDHILETEDHDTSNLDLEASINTELIEEAIERAGIR